MNWVKKYITPLALFFLSVIVYRNWFSFSLLSYGDYVYYFHESLASFLPLSIWKSNFGFGSVDILLWRTPQNIVYGLLGSAGFDLNVIDRFVVLGLWVIISWVSIYLLLRFIFKSEIAIFIGSLVFIFNTYSLTISSQGQLLISIAGCFAVISLLFFIKLMVKQRIIYLVLSVSFLFLTASYDLRVLYMAVLVLFCYFIFHVLFIDKVRVTNIFKKSLYAAGSIIGFCFLSLYWILPLMHSSSLTGNSVLSRQLFGNEFLNINYAFTVFHPFWTGAIPAWFEVQTIPIYFWLVPLFAFLGLIFGIKNKLVLFFGIISIIGVFLTKQVSVPFPFVYPLLFKYLPGFSAFREASKFYFLVILGYSVLMAAFVDWLWLKKSKYIFMEYEKYLLLILVMSLFLWNIKPFLTGEIGSLLVPRSIDQDYSVLRKFINNQDNFFRVAWVPASSRWHFATSIHPEVSVVNSLTSGQWKSLIEEKIPVNYVDGDIIHSFLQQDNSNVVFDNSSIKYVVVPLVDSDNEGNIFQSYGKSRNFYLEQLDHLSWLKKINIGLKNIRVYENDNFVPHIFTSDTASGSNNKDNQSFQYSSNELNTTFNSISPTQYAVQISHIKDVSYLDFSESYHPNWKIRVGNFNGWEGIVTKDYFLPDDIHRDNEYQLNTYRIDPAAICKDFTCQKNSDGSYTINMTLYFVPQIYLYIGGVVSGLSFVALVSYLTYVLIKYFKLISYKK